MKRRLSIFWTISVLLGLAFGLQQTTSILLSSFHDLATFPKTSLVAVAFILWFHALFWGLFGLVFGWLIEKFGREGMKKDKFTIPLAFGLGAGLVVFVFLFGRFHSVFNKKIIKFLLLGVSLGVGGISAFFV